MNRFSLKGKIASGEPIIGTWNTFGSTIATKVLASSGLDFQIIDFEHGPFQIAEVHDHIASSMLYDCSCLVRIPSNQDWMALQALDQGAEGILVPHIHNLKSAEDARNIIKYFPLGDRGFSPFTSAGDYTNENVEQFHLEANDNTVLVVLLESIEAIDQLDLILKIPEIDVIYIGAYDLSKSLGIPGDIFNKKIINIVEKAAEKINSSGKIAGSFVPQSTEQLKFCVDLGLKFITYSVDTFELKDAFMRAHNYLKKLG